MNEIVNIRDFTSELKFSSSRSSGPGGQNVNKVNSKVELRFDVNKSELLSEDEKVLLLKKLKTKINIEGELIITAQEDRSQLKNKQDVIEKFHALIIKALTPVKKRRPTNPTKSSVEKRLKQKKEGSEIKQMRKKINEI
ncbi:MAG: aminoacyl-tRNA hydrolase [Prolixibacteraceae bacterium]|nr:aminoacyl-tRNA hydrolase [Prolixibacteraceae bacterium]